MAKEDVVVRGVGGAVILMLAVVVLTIRVLVLVLAVVLLVLMVVQFKKYSALH